MGVVIPPDIKDDESANGLVVHENGNVRLRCAATGTPVPTVVWKREDGKNIITRDAGQTKSIIFAYPCTFYPYLFLCFQIF